MYTCSVKFESFRVFPKNKKGETIVVPVIRTVFTLRHRTGEEITFRRFLYRKEWKWGDSRIKGSISENHVVSEIARMMFGGDENKAVDLIVQNLLMSAA